MADNRHSLVSSNDSPGWLHILLRARAMIIVCITLATSIALLYLHMATYTYQVSVLVTPISQPERSLSSNLENIASMAGVTLPSSPDTGLFQLYLAGLQSRAAADIVARETDLMRQMFSDSWSTQANDWREPTDTVYAAKALLRRIIGVPDDPWHPPSGADLQLFLSRELIITKTRTSPIVTVSLNTANPRMGIQLLNSLHTTVDELLRKRTLTRTQDSIAYLNEELKKITVADYRTAILSVLTDQEKQMMMANSTVAFVAEPFGEPIASSRPVNPKALPVLIGAVVVGFAAGIGGDWLFRLGGWRHRSRAKVRMEQPLRQSA